MGRNKPNKSLVQQVKETFDAKLAIGKSKYAAKRDGTHTQYIYSWDTYRSYLKHACYFIRWCKEQPADPALGHKPRTLEECRLFAEKWIQYEIDRGLSAYTLKLELSALAKLYGCKTTDFDIKTPPRKRKNITRSRGNAARDKHFSLSENRDFVTFCKCTGLRRAELSQIRGSDLIVHDGNLCIDIKRGTKGGRPRISPVVGSDAEIEVVKKICKTMGDNKIFPKPSENADIHSFRAEYAKRIYDRSKREYKDFKNERLIVYKNHVVGSYISKNGRRDELRFARLCNDLVDEKRMLSNYKDVSGAFRCRNDLKGNIYDRRALFETARALGHNREVVVSDHYLYG